MSLILLALSTLQKSNGQISVCSLPIRTKTCGDNFSCHYTPDVEQILHSFGLTTNEEVKKSFTMPQKWFCNEYVLFTLRQIEEESKKQRDPLSIYMQKRTVTPLAQKIVEQTKQIIELNEEEIETEIMNKDSVMEIFSYLEENQMRCYYALSKQYKEDNEVKGIEMVICYQESKEHLNFIPNATIKVVFDVVYHLSGKVEIIDSIISKDEEVTFKKIVDFEKSIETDV